MTTKAREVMTGEVEVIKSDETMLEAAKRMAKLDVGSLPICDGDRLKGMITDRDIVTKVLALDRDPAKVTASELETGNPVTIGADDTIEDAMRTMEEHQVRRLPVIDGHKLVGMLSQGDLAKVLSKKDTGRLLDKLSS